MSYLICIDQKPAIAHLAAHDNQFNVIAVSARYLPILAIATSSVKDHNGSRRMPAATVSGSPIIGTQLRSRDALP